MSEQAINAERARLLAERLAMREASRLRGGAVTVAELRARDSAIRGSYRRSVPPVGSRYHGNPDADDYEGGN